MSRQGDDSIQRYDAAGHSATAHSCCYLSCRRIGAILKLLFSHVHITLGWTAVREKATQDVHFETRLVHGRVENPRGPAQCWEAVQCRWMFLVYLLRGRGVVQTIHNSTLLPDRTADT